MICTVTIGTARYDVDLGTGYGIGIPLNFHGVQPNFFDVPQASSNAVQGGGFIGDARRGGSCNVETATLSPHCNGTHTECIGHLTQERISIERMLPGSLMPATLLSVPVLPSATVAERYSCAFKPGDMLITSAVLLQAFDKVDPQFIHSLILRTLPNLTEKLSQHYASKAAPFFTIDAMEVIVDFGVQHLLVDVPSLDRADDGGRMAAHRVFWGLDDNATDVTAGAAVSRTITEMIFVPDHIRDGNYLLNLQIAPFVSDAAPSRPILFPIAPRP